MQPLIYYRASQMEPGELAAAERHFRCVPSRMTAGNGDLVIARYSALPFYRELYEDLRSVGATLINSLVEHEYIADLKNYVADLGELTPRTWYRMEDVPKDGGPFVLKGATNSKKHDWARSMFAADWRGALDVQGRLQNDSLIGAQDIYIREYVPLVRLGEAIGGLPLTKEFRFFVCRQTVLCGGFYWHAFHDDVLEQHGSIPSVDEVPMELLDAVIRRVGDNATFYVVDVGQTATGAWIVIELNDGQMSGLSENDPEVLYRRLREVVAP